MIGIHNTTWPLSSYICLCRTRGPCVWLSHFIKVDHMWSVPLSLTLISYSPLYGVSLCRFRLAFYNLLLYIVSSQAIYYVLMSSNESYFIRKLYSYHVQMSINFRSTSFCKWLEEKMLEIKIQAPTSNVYENKTQGHLSIVQLLTV